MQSIKKDKLLLHICCAGCGAYVSQVMREEYDVSLFYYNPNIYSHDEYLKRQESVEKISKHFDLPIFYDDYNHEEWLKKVAGYEKAPEKGDRCFICYEDRINKAFEFAIKNDFQLVTTTLTISPHKVAKKILEIGRELSRVSGVAFLERDFKKQDGFKKSVELSRKLGLYRQNYCGCEFSLR